MNKISKQNLDVDSEDIGSKDCLDSNVVSFSSESVCYTTEVTVFIKDIYIYIYIYIFIAA